MTIERLAADWDGEGALATNELSAAYAERFAAFVPDVGLEPCHYVNGNVSLFKSDATMYVEAEFWPNGKVVYFIERGMETTKGTVSIGTPGRLVELLT